LPPPDGRAGNRKVNSSRIKVKLAYILSTLCFLAASTYPYQELIGWPPLFFGYDWVNNKTQITLLTPFILASVVCIQKVVKKRQKERQTVSKQSGIGSIHVYKPSLNSYYFITFMDN
jgi:hypothetical protein